MAVQFWSLKGECSYAKIAELQKRLVELRAQDLCPDTVLFLEHHPVITRGRGLQFIGSGRPRHMPIPEALPAGVEFCESKRGGDLTYHGPGQLVVYPICKLDGSGFGPNRDVLGFLRKLETLLIVVLAEYGLQACSRKNATGVWVGKKKVASIGVAVRKWVTYHGIAINVVNDLKPFHLILPCGFAPEVMGRVADLVPETSALRMSSWRTELEENFARQMRALCDTRLSRSADKTALFL